MPKSNMTTAAEDTLSLFYNGTEWVEISRSSVSTGGGATEDASIVANIEQTNYIFYGQ